MPSLPWRASLVAVCAVAAACGGQHTLGASPTAPVARVGSEAITLAVFDARLQSAVTSIQQAGGPAQSNSAMQTGLRASVLRSLILDTVIAQEATALGIEATEADVDAQVSAAERQSGGASGLQTALAEAGGSIAQLRDEIRSQLNEQRLEDHFAKQRVELVEQQLASGQSFASLAQSSSDDTGTSSKGGDLGALTSADLAGDDPAFVGAVRALHIGAYTTAPVHDSGGYDIVELYATTPATWSVRHILVAAPTPYTVKGRPAWFSEALFSTVAQLCSQHRIHVFISDAGGDPCSGAPLATPAPG